MSDGPLPAAIAPLTVERGRALLARFSGITILVAGDVMLDQFLIGRVDRISPEAPVPIVRFQRDEHRLGGAANVAHNVAALGARVDLVGVVGSDGPAAQVREQLRPHGVDAGGLVVDPSRPTTRKMRIVTDRNQQVARVDYEEDAEIGPEIESALIARASRSAGSASAIVISDYLKGVATRRIVASLLAIGRERRIPVLIDPKIPHLDYYAGATLITPNHHETEIATHMRIRRTEDARTAARRFQARTGCDEVLMTLGERGMWVSGTACEGPLPAAAREVADVTGAGDTVIALLALALAAGADLGEAAWLANQGAGIVVGKFGPATLTPQELLDALAASRI